MIIVELGITNTEGVLQWVARGKATQRSSRLGDWSVEGSS